MWRKIGGLLSKLLHLRAHHGMLPRMLSRHAHTRSRGSMLLLLMLMLLLLVLLLQLLLSMLLLLSLLMLSRLLCCDHLLLLH